MQQFWKIVQRELHLLLHDSDVFLLALVAPLFYSLFYGSLYINKGEHDVPIAVVDCDRTATSRSFLRSLESHELLSVSFTTGDLADALSRLNMFEVQGIVYIPSRFEADIRGGKSTSIPLYLNTTRFLVSNDINKAVTSVTLTFAAATQLHAAMGKGLHERQTEGIVEPLRLQVRPLFNVTESYGDFLTPAILVLVLHQLFFLLLGQTYAKEREEKSLGMLFSLGENSVWRALSGKTIFYVVLFFSYACLFFTVHFQLFSIPRRGSLLVLGVFTVLFFLALTFWVLFIVSFFKRKIVALQIIALTTYPLFLISGYTWPVDSLPILLQLVSRGLPLTPYLAGFTRIVFMGADLCDVFQEVIHLFLLSFCGAIAVWYRYTLLLKKAEHC